MSMQRLGLLTLIGICSYTGYYLLEKHYWIEENIQIQSDKTTPLFTAKNIFTHSFNDKGIREYQLFSDHIEYFSTIDETHFTQPILTTFKKGEEQEWKITSQHAVLKDKKELHMVGDVKIFNLLPNAQIKIVKTSKLILNLTNQDFWSDTHTQIKGTQSTSQGEQMKGNFAKLQIKLFGDVKSKHEQ